MAEIKSLISLSLSHTHTASMLSRSIVNRVRSGVVARGRSIATKANMDYLTPTHLDDDVPQSVLDQLDRHSKVTLNTYSRPDFVLARGKGCRVYDTRDREYLDFSGGIAVNALGHADEGVARVVEDQAKRLVHCSNLWHNEHSGELAYSIVDHTIKLGGMGYSGRPQRGETAQDGGLKVFFTNSGTESNEGAIKFARKYGKHVELNKSASLEGTTTATQTQTHQHEKVEIVSFRDGFHGRSMGALSATWQDKYQAPFAPLIPGFVPATLNDIAAIDQAVTEKTCGVIVEPIQGEGGILEASEDFLRALRKRCDQVGALLIYDEIQASFSLFFSRRKERGSILYLTHEPRSIFSADSVEPDLSGLTGRSRSIVTPTF